MNGLRTISSSVAAYAAGLFLLVTTALAEPATLTIVHFNDMDRLDGSGDRGGVARLATVVNEARAGGGTVLVTNGGDSISPSLLSAFDQGAHIIDLFNKIGLSAMAVGNHEFDFGPDVTRTRIGEANFPMLSNNAIEPDGTLVDGVTDHLMVEVGAYKVGVFGLTTASTAVKSSPGNVTFRPATEVAAEQAKKLRDAGANLVIALAHTDRSEDAELIRQGAVDVLLSGDDHDVRVDFSSGVLFAESGEQADFVTVVELVMDMKEGRRGPRFEWEPSYRVINTAFVTPDPAMAKEVQVYLDQLSKELDVEIGTTDSEIDSRRSTVRSQEAAIGNVITDAMRTATNADIAITNGGGIRADKVYPPGTVLTRRDIQSELPFGNVTVVLELPGAQVKAALENGVSQVENGGGRFPQVSGVSFSYDASKPAGSRINSIMIGGAPLDPAKVYRVATNDFIARGGDGYGAFVGARLLIDAAAGELMAAQVINHIAGAGTIAPKAEGRIKRLD